MSMNSETTPDPFVTTRRVEFCDTDMAGIVHFSNFYKWMEQAEHELFRHVGLTIMNHQPDGSIIGWPRVRGKCAFEAPARYEEVMSIHVLIARMGMKSLTYDIEFYRDQTRLAYGQMKSVCCRVDHTQTLQSIEIPQHYRDRLSKYCLSD